MSTRTSRRRDGFTLIEVLLVLMILAIVAGLGTIAIFNMQASGYRNAALTKVKLYQSACDMYRLSMGHYPTKQEGGLQALLQQPAGLSNPKKWTGPYITTLENDPWDNPYQFESTGTQVKIWSMGPDGADNTGDEISNLDAT